MPTTPSFPVSMVVLTGIALAAAVLFFRVYHARHHTMTDLMEMELTELVVEGRDVE